MVVLSLGYTRLASQAAPGSDLAAAAEAADPAISRQYGAAEAATVASVAMAKARAREVGQGDSRCKHQASMTSDIACLRGLCVTIVGLERPRPLTHPQLGPSCDDVLNQPSKRKDSSDRHSQRDDHDWKHDEDKHPESRQHVRSSPPACRDAAVSRDGDSLGGHRHRLRGSRP